MSMTFRGRLLAATVCVGVLSAATLSAAPARAETLADALALAYENNPTLQAQRATQRALDESYVQARSGWRPTLGLAGSVRWNENQTPLRGRGQDFDGDGVPDTPGALVGGATRSNVGQAALTFTQPLWTGGRVAAAVNAANADVLAGRENLRRVEAQVLASVIQAYADTRRDQEALRIRQENVRVLGRQLEESQARFDVGEVTRTDVAQSQARLSQADALLQQAVAQLAITRAGYAALVGQNPGELAPEPSLAFLLPTNPDEAYEIAEDYNPQLRAQQYAELASRARLSGARAERMPQISTQFQAGHQGRVDPWDPRDSWGRGYSATVNASIPLFNGGLTTSRVRAAVERNNADKITVEGVRRTVLQT
ncbi:MAG: TolC family outer membrane protein, partial [Phenylobacterium sp.]|nr:TolC family outer membrane protein [Phenylobacterium sp.]